MEEDIEKEEDTENAEITPREKIKLAEERQLRQLERCRSLKEMSHIWEFPVSKLVASKVFERIQIMGALQAQQALFSLGE